jgi:hypothetical protein
LGNELKERERAESMGKGKKRFERKKERRWICIT